MAIVAAMILGASAFYWIRVRGSSVQPAIASAPPTPASTPAEKGPKEARGAAEPESVPSKPKKEAPAADIRIPLRTGEVLEYTADVAKLSNVGNLRLQTVEQRNFLGKAAWHLQAFARTENPLRMIFELDDRFDSYSDAAALLSLQYEMHLSERGQKVDSVQRMTATGKEPAPEDASEARVLPGTRDPLGMMQYLRNVDWPKTRDARGPVYDGHKLYDVRATLAAPSETVTVPAGTYTATKVEIRVFDNGEEMKDAHFFVYLAHNDVHTPVLLEAVLPWTTARVGLKSSK